MKLNYFWKLILFSFFMKFKLHFVENNKIFVENKKKIK